MKFAQISAFTAALALSSLAMAEGGGDRTFEKMMTANDRSVELYVAREQARDPVVVNDKKDAKTQDL
ncbi:co-regulatory protein PtrA N-terminal domain-containing protein [Pseudomonas sp. Irchel s3h9]|uniref:co-regulatory protein PtrA N-terminal domain-containing protein n=1 Tax=Pseudomonas sp. Irchel s3h9 TaxID=2009192 RepID=UPI000BA47126|nr:co-regulatory protein PtrA N-terminal domain-containing protein [Pseudomonas sp. Irchel s3h9]